jgi:ATP-dependent Zn protease
VAATTNAAVYVGVYGMGSSLISSLVEANELENAITATLSDKERRREVDALLSDCRDRVRNLLLKKRLVVEGVRDALLEREELIGDEIEILMAELGEREPIVVPAAQGDGPDSRAGGNGQAGGGNGQGAPPRPDGAPPA